MLMVIGNTKISMVFDDEHFYRRHYVAVGLASIFSKRVHVRYIIGRPSVCLSVVCNVRAPYSGD